MNDSQTFKLTPVRTLSKEEAYSYMLAVQPLLERLHKRMTETQVTTVTTQEALLQAEEALSLHLTSFEAQHKLLLHLRNPDFTMMRDKARGALAAVRAALAERSARNPVAWADPLDLEEGNQDFIVGKDVMVQKWPKDSLRYKVPLYTEVDSVGEVPNKQVVYDALERKAQNRTSMENVEDVLAALRKTHGSVYPLATKHVMSVRYANANNDPIVGNSLMEHSLPPDPVEFGTIQSLAG